MTQPPLLAVMQGGEYAAPTFRHFFTAPITAYFVDSSRVRGRRPRPEFASTENLVALPRNSVLQEFRGASLKFAVVAFRVRTFTTLSGLSRHSRSCPYGYSDRN